MGIVSKKGGYTSHSAILARARNIPYIICDFPDDFEGNILIKENEIILNPDEVPAHLDEDDDKVNYDLEDVNIYCNINTSEEVVDIDNHFKGIGLFRTEYLLDDEDIIVDYNKQAKIYENILEKAGNLAINFRTFDIGDDKRNDYLVTDKKGVSNYYRFPLVFKNQIKALLLAKKKYNDRVVIMFPMIERVEEFMELKKTVILLAKELNVKIPKIGMMLETEKALNNLESFRCVDFISIGTNDLTKELFNIDRNQVFVYDEIYDALVDIIKRIVLFGKRNNIKVSICGELVNKKEFAKKIYDVGMRNFSVSKGMLKNIYKALG